jgi:hypothetical protein
LRHYPDKSFTPPFSDKEHDRSVLKKVDRVSF